MKKITQNVNKDKLFNDLPKVVPDASQWGTTWTNYQACNASEIVPIYWDEVLPGEKRKIDLGMISHTTTPTAPMFPSLYTECRAFFVPARLCADLLNGYKDRKSPWVKVFGEDNASTSADIIVPLNDQKLPSLSEDFISAIDAYNASADDDNILDSLDMSGSDFASDKANYLNLAAYELIYQRHYRNENYESATESCLYQFLFNAYNAEEVGALDNYFRFHIANREKDYFTGMKPFTQKSSSPVSINVGTEAKLKTSAGYSLGSGNALTFTDSNNNTAYVGNDALNLELGSGAPINGINLVADLTTAKGLSIEELRLLIKTQELLEKDSLYGSLYAESLNAHFGTCPLDLTLQDPAELYKTTITSHMQAIFQTSSTSGESSILGTIGANSTTQTEPFTILPLTEFKEHGILMICAVHKMQNVYDTRFFKPKFLFKQSRFDFYTPELNDLGYQPVTDLEMTSGNGVVGFNEAFAEYRYKFNKSHGSLNKSFPYWAPAIANEYASAAALYKEDTAILDKALSVRSATAPQFYDAWGFREYNDKPMTLHSIPGSDGVI